MPALASLSARSYRIPTTGPEADGTIEWDATVLVLITIQCADVEGIGYSYTSPAAITIIKDLLLPAIEHHDLFDIPACWQSMRRAVRNIGQSGVAATAISAVDIALWDAKAKCLKLPLASLLGKSRDRIAVYGSGGFTTYGPDAIQRQFDGWKADGIRLFKIKIGKDDLHDRRRIEAALAALPAQGVLFVDANGAYHPKQALAMADYLGDHPVAWFEEPVTSDDIAGLAFVRAHAPPTIDIAAGEYGYVPDDARRMLENEAVDVLQIDATRALGITGFLNMAAQAEAFHRPISAHCAPALHTPLCCHATDAVHLEYFWDHARIEGMAFDGVDHVNNGYLAPNDEPGLGLTFKAKDMEIYAA